MVDIRHILCPIDFSDASRHALQHAVAIATWYRSRITALHVIHTTLVPQPILGMPMLDTPPPTVSNQQACEEQLESWLEPARQAGLQTDVLVTKSDRTAARIIDEASSRQSDLIVMGTHGFSDFDRFILGSVSEKVLRKAPCPVLTVPPAAMTAAKLPYTRLLCPVDFSPSSLEALRFAFSLAKEADASITILHAFDWGPDDELLVERFDVPEFRRVVEGSVRQRLDALVTDEERVWSKPSTRIEYGKPYRRILEAACSEASDLIVIGVRGRNPIDLALFGSTTNQVVRRAPCPVLTLRS